MVKILGLKYGKKYETDSDIATLRYGKIMIMADQDVVRNFISKCTKFGKFPISRPSCFYVCVLSVYFHVNFVAVPPISVKI